MKIFKICALIFGFTIFHTMAGERDAEWAKVDEAQKLDQPKTVMSLLAKIERAAFADQAWAEGAKALTKRIALEGITEDQAALIRKLDTALVTAPKKVHPVLQAISAQWMTAYLKANQWRFAQRGAVTLPVEANFEGYDLARILKVIDERLQATLATEASLKEIPAAEFAELFSEGALGDSYRPTLYDLVAQAALDFYKEELVAVARPIDAFEIDAESPVFGSVKEFLAWQPESKEKEIKEAHAIFSAGGTAFQKHAFGKLCANEKRKLEQPIPDFATESQWTPVGEEIEVTHRSVKQAWFRAYPVCKCPGPKDRDLRSLDSDLTWIFEKLKINDDLKKMNLSPRVSHHLYKRTFFMEDKALSDPRWQDGFGYYEVTRDTASHFFIDRLPAGTHIFETSVRVQHRGRYQTGTAEIRCLNAPEFAAHSASLPIEVK